MQLNFFHAWQDPLGLQPLLATNMASIHDFLTPSPLPVTRPANELPPKPRPMHIPYFQHPAHGRAAADSMPHQVGVPFNSFA